MRTIDLVVVILNPKSTKAKKGLVEKFKRDLAKAAPKLRLVILKTEYPGHAEKLARKFRKDKRAVILSASGDGVYSEVLNGVMTKPDAEHPLLGVIPSGNANDHHHAIAKGSVVEHIVKGKSRALDVLRVDYTTRDGDKKTRYAHSYIGFGLTMHIRKQLDEKNVNNITEKFVAARSFVDSKPVNIARLNETLEIDSLVFTNINVIAKFFKLKDSKPDDGKYEVHIVHHSTQLHKAGEVLRIGTKKSTARSRSSAYSFTMLEASSMQVDGEIFKLAKDSRVVVSLARGALTTVI